MFGKASGFSVNLELLTLNGTNGFQINGEATVNFSGRSVSSAGDVNGDGFADIIIGAFGANSNGGSSGASYVVFGKASGFSANLELSTLNGTNGFKISGEAAFDFSGISVSSAGDVNGDGFDDVFVGANGADTNGSASGASYVVFGKASGFSANLNLSTLNGTNGFQISGEVDGDNSGNAVSSAGDVNGDGLADLVIGAFGADPNGAYSGASYVVFGRKPDTAVNRTGSNASQNLVGSDFADVLSGLGGNDRLYGHNGVDILIGGSGNDWLNGGAGNDSMVGGDNDDTFIVDNVTDIVVETNASATGGQDRILSSVTRVLGANIEDLILFGPSAINGTGNALSNTIIGNAAANQLNGAAGADTMIGGNGDDTYIVDNVADVVSEASALATGGIDRIVSTVTRTLGANQEQLVHIGAGNINGTGNALANYIVGNTGNNVLYGLDGNDSINGGAGNDFLNGGAGVDGLTGGAGFDTFFFNTASPSLNRDIITDFVAADDTIRLENAIFTALGAATGFLAAAMFKSNATGTATDADDRIVYNTTTGALIYDVNGSGAGGAFQFATLSSKPTISAADFLVV